MTTVAACTSVLVSVLVALFVYYAPPARACEEPLVLVAVLAKDKAHVLPYYLRALELQDYPKRRMALYVRTNNNNDGTAGELQAWLEDHGDQYHSVTYSDADVEQRVERFAPHEWNAERFSVLGHIRQQSVRAAQELELEHAHYFVADCDNLLTNRATLRTLVHANVPVAAPMLESTHNNGWYSNFHAAVDEQGYYADSLLYYDVFHRRTAGLIRMPVVHCTYLVRNEALHSVRYDDASGRHEYVVFSDALRKAGVHQYLDNREHYGYLTMADNRRELEAEPWFPDMLRALEVYS